MLNLKNIKEAIELVSVILVGSTAVTKNVMDSAVSGSSALKVLAEDDRHIDLFNGFLLDVLVFNNKFFNHNGI